MIGGDHASEAGPKGSHFWINSKRAGMQLGGWHTGRNNNIVLLLVPRLIGEANERHASVGGWGVPVACHKILVPPTGEIFIRKWK